jgi:hypothetical protein
MDGSLTPTPPAEEPTLTISVDIRPSDFAYVVRWGVARTFRWRQLLSPVIVLSAAGFLFTTLRLRSHGPGIAVSLLIGLSVAFGAYLAIPYLIGARLARSASKNRIQLAFSQAGIHVTRYDGEDWLSWPSVEVVETPQMLHFVSDGAACWLPKRLLTPPDDALVRQLAAGASGHVLPSR